MRPARSECWVQLVALAGGAEATALLDMMACMYGLWAYNADLPFRLCRPGDAEEQATRRRLRIEGLDPAWLAEREDGVHRMRRVAPDGEARPEALVGVRAASSRGWPMPACPQGWGPRIRTLFVDEDPRVVNHRSGFICRDSVGVFAGDLPRFWEERR
jgi:hypothetical protein